MQSKSNQLMVLILVLSLLFSFNSKAQNLNQIDQILKEKYDQNGPGATVLISKKGKIIYRKAFGQANLELNMPMQPENVFQIGSMTKQITAVAILMLEEQGKLNLTDEITKFIPDYPTHGKKITIHHLLNHTSGIKSYTSMRGLRDIARDDLSPMELINFFKNEPMDFDSGTAYKYNNSGYILLGYIIEKVSQQSYEAFIEEHIFNKLHMNSSFYGSHQQLISNRASGYEKRKNGHENTIYISLSIPYAAGSVMSSVDDLYKWQQAIQHNILVKATTIQKAFTNYTLTNGSSINYGYGWGLNEINGITTYEHGGRIFGYTSMGVYIPQEDIYVVILSNCSCNSPTSAAVQIAAIVLEKPFSKKDRSITLSQKELQKWTGTYTFEDGAIRTITLQEGKLYSDRKGGGIYEIYPVSQSHFYFEDSFAEYQFSKIKGKKQAQFKDRIKSNIGIAQ